MVTGRLSGTLDGRPVHIDATAAGITLGVRSFSTAWRLRKSSGLAPLLRLLAREEIPLRLAVAGIFSVALLPAPGLVVRLAAPEFARLG